MSKNERFHNWGQVQAAKEGHMFALVTTRAKAGGSTTPAIFVTALFDTFDEDMIKSVLIAPGTKENNVRTLIQSEPEFTYIFGQQTWMEIRDLIDKKHPDWNIAEAAKKLQQERALKKWSGTQLKKSGMYHGFIFINNNNVGVGTYDLEVDAAYARDRTQFYFRTTQKCKRYLNLSFKYLVLFRRRNVSLVPFGAILTLPPPPWEIASAISAEEGKSGSIRASAPRRTSCSGLAPKKNHQNQPPTS